MLTAVIFFFFSLPSVVTHRAGKINQDFAKFSLFLVSSFLFSFFFQGDGDGDSGSENGGAFLGDEESGGEFIGSHRQSSFDDRR